MKKITIILFLIILNIFSYAQTYESGFENGYSFGHNFVSEYVAAHPELGQNFSFNEPYQITQSNYYGNGSTGTNMPININGVYSYSYSVGYNAFQVAEVAISSLWANHAYQWLLERTYISDFHQGVYDGFYQGTYDAMWSFQ